MGRKTNSFFIVLLLNIICFYTNAQVGINTQNPFHSSEMEIRNVVLNGDTIPKGILIPRMTEKQRDKIDVSAVTEANGLLVYNIDEDCYIFYPKSNNEGLNLSEKYGLAKLSSITRDYIEDI